MLYVAIGSLILALTLFVLAFLQRKKAGMPAGRVIYVDTSQWMKVEKPLYDRKLHLTGKPDYLVKRGKQVIPIELKSGRAGAQPRAWHVSQLAAYCMLVESEFGTHPDYGMLHYPDQTISVPFSKSIESATLALLQEMQQRSSQVQIKRSHHDLNRCLHCGYRSVCDQALRI